MHKRHPQRFLKEILIELKTESRSLQGCFVYQMAPSFRAHCLKKKPRWSGGSINEFDNRGGQTLLLRKWCSFCLHFLGPLNLDFDILPPTLFSIFQFEFSYSENVTKKYSKTSLIQIREIKRCKHFFWNIIRASFCVDLYRSNLGQNIT